MSGRTKSDVSAYKFPQKVKLSGVTIIAVMVLMAVSETESSTFPRLNELIKLEMFPPGQAEL